MSEYFRVLRRLERERPAPQPKAAPTAMGPRVRALVSVATPAADRAAAEPLLRQPPPDRAAVYATLYDNLRAVASGQPLRALVVAGVVSAAGVDRVVAGLAAHVRRAGQRVVLGRLSDGDGRRRLVTVPSDGEPSWSSAAPLSLDLNSHAETAAIGEWIRGHVGAADLACVAAGGLGSVDAAMLACACDGLVIVVDAEHTPRAALRAAVARAGAVGCRLLGLVVVGSRDPLPAWLRGLLPAEAPRLRGRDA
jgi:Mrp family chromosome partitioning ATPase